MGLTSPFGSAPFGSGPGKFDFTPPERVRYWEPWPRRMRALVGDETVLDSRRGVQLWETGRFSRFYYPLDDVRSDFLVPSARPRQEGKPQKWGLRIADREISDCVTASPLTDDGELLPGMVSLRYHAMDGWFEEDDPIYAHPRDPYHRVDVRLSSRHVVVRHEGEVVGESHRPKLLFETNNPIRYYLPFVDVRADLLTRSETVSPCPYKGEGQHWHVTTAAGTVEDAAWSLPHPLPEGLAAAQHICFYPEKVDVEVDGERVTA